MLQLNGWVRWPQVLNALSPAILTAPRSWRHSRSVTCFCLSRRKSSRPPPGLQDACARVCVLADSVFQKINTRTHTHSLTHAHTHTHTSTCARARARAQINVPFPCVCAYVPSSVPLLPPAHHNCLAGCQDVACSSFIKRVLARLLVLPGSKFTASSACVRFRTCCNLWHRAAARASHRSIQWP